MGAAVRQGQFMRGSSTRRRKEDEEEEEKTEEEATFPGYITGFKTVHKSHILTH